MPIKRLFRKAKLIPTLRKNSEARARRKAGWQWETLRMGRSPDRIAESRKQHAQLLNRSRGKGKNSSWKLTGIRKK